MYFDWKNTLKIIYELSKYDFFEDLKGRRHLTGNTLFVFTPLKINLELNAYLIYVSL